MKVAKEHRDIRQSERLIIKSRDRERRSVSDIEKGRARYRGARRRKASPETQSRTDKGLGKTKKRKKGGKEKDDERERESPKLYLLWPEPGFETFAQGASFCIFCSFVNPTVRLLQENFNHKARRHARNGLPSLTECRSPSRSLSAELQANSRRPGLGPAGWRSALEDDGEPHTRRQQTAGKNGTL